MPEGERDVAFLQLWAAKEAAAKALGTGFSMPPEAIRVEGFPHGAVWRARPEAIAKDVALRIQYRKIGHPGLKLRSKMLEAGLTGGLVVAAASIA
jgi:phosphopantetheinyl transferase (holo-ACP synthase)